jgi:hypothetical protein
MTALLLLLALSLQDAARLLADHPVFTAGFRQELATPEGETLKDGGKVRFAWGKGVRFDYVGKERRSYVFVPDGWYSKTADGPWDFQPWEEASAQMEPFLFILNGKVPEGTGWTVARRAGTLVIDAPSPSFSLILDAKTGWPRTLKVKQEDGSVNTLEFKGHKAGAERVLP